MKHLKNLKINLLICLTLIFSALVIGEVHAERFYQKHSTWYEKIPANPKVQSDSAILINSIIKNANWWSSNDGSYSVPIFRAAVDTPSTTVEILVQDTVNNHNQKTWILTNGWNKVPIPKVAVPAGNTEACSGAYMDGHMVIISYDKRYAWEFSQATHCPGQAWKAKTIRKWDLVNSDGLSLDPTKTSNGIHPWGEYDFHVSPRVAGVPVLHGLITYNEVKSGVIDHALSFCYWGVRRDNGHWSLYPGVKYGGDPDDGPLDGMLGGERIQLDPTFDCNSQDYDNFNKMVCVAMQQYGMIFTEMTSKGYNYVFMEHLLNDPAGRKWSDLGINTDLRLKIPLNRLRVVEPLMPPFNTSSSPDPSSPPNPPFVLE